MNGKIYMMICDLYTDNILILILGVATTNFFDLCGWNFVKQRHCEGA